MIPLAFVWAGETNLFGHKVIFYRDTATDDYWGYWRIHVNGEKKGAFHKWAKKPKCLT